MGRGVLFGEREGLTSYPRNVPMTLREPFSCTSTRLSRYCILC